MERHSKPFKKSWRYDEEEVPRHLSHWYGRRLSNITRQDVQRLHEKLHHEKGLYQANKTVQRLRSIVNKGIEWGWQGANPTAGIKFYKEVSRDRFIQPSEMPCLVRALNEEANETAKDFLWILLLTGARKTNTLMMRWEQLSWERKEWRIPETKNGDPVTVPLTERAIDILKRRKEAATSAWVFPQDNDLEKHFGDPRSAWQRILGRASLYLWAQDEKLAPWLEVAIRKAPAVYLSGESVFKSVTKRAIREKVILPASMRDIRLHDVRRTFGSYQALTGASLQVIGRSLGHKSMAATQIYARLNLDPVRASIEKATEAMFQL
jgi:integrase